MYKYLLWDIDGTVLDFLASEAYAVRLLFKKYNLGECSDEMLDVYSAINRKYWDMLEMGEITKPEVLIGRFREFFAGIGVDVSIAEAFNDEYQLALGDHIEFVENAKEMLVLNKGKHILAAITNGTKVAQDKKLRMSGLDKIFDYIYISEDVGVEKPNKEFFDYVIENMGIADKKEALIIGDSLAADMKGGYISGIDTCWFNPYNKQNTMNIPVTYEIDNLNKLPEIID